MWIGGPCTNLTILRVPDVCHIYISLMHEDACWLMSGPYPQKLRIAKIYETILSTQLIFLDWCKVLGCIKALSIEAVYTASWVMICYLPLFNTRSEHGLRGFNPQPNMWLNNPP